MEYILCIDANDFFRKDGATFPSFAQSVIRRLTVYAAFKATAVHFNTSGADMFVKNSPSNLPNSLLSCRRDDSGKPSFTPASILDGKLSRMSLQ